MGYNQVVQCSDLHIVVLFFVLLYFVLGGFSAAPSMVLNSLRACKEQTQKQNSNVDLGYLRLIWSQVEMGVQIIFMILLIKKTQEIKLNEINCIYY